MNATEYKQFLFGIILLDDISDAGNATEAELEAIYRRRLSATSVPRRRKFPGSAGRKLGPSKGGYAIANDLRDASEWKAFR